MITKTKREILKKMNDGYALEWVSGNYYYFSKEENGIKTRGKVSDKVKKVHYLLQQELSYGGYITSNGKGQWVLTSKGRAAVADGD